MSTGAGPDPDRVRSVLTGVLRPAMLHRFSPDSCVAAARLVLDVLAAGGVRGKAVPVVLEAVNADYVLMQAGEVPAPAVPPSAMDPGGPWCVQIGDPDDPGAGGGVGHVVVLAGIGGQQWLIDLAADQASRPHKRLTVTPVMARLSEPFDRPGDQACFPMADGGLLRYTRIAARLYTRSPNWRGTTAGGRQAFRDCFTTTRKAWAAAGLAD